MFARSRTVATLAAALFVVFASSAVTRGQALVDRVPADAIVYFGWQGADGLAGPYAQSRLKAVIDATDARQLLGDFIPKLVQKAGEQDRQAAEAVGVMAGLAGPMWKHPTAFFFSGMEWEGLRGQPGQPGQGGQPMPKLALVCQAGAQAGEIKKQIDDLMKDAPPEARQVLKTYQSEDLIGVYVGYNDLKTVLAPKGGAGPSLASADMFRAALAQAGKDPAAVVYLDFDRLMALVDTTVDRFGDGQTKDMWPKVRDATGLKGLRQAIWTSGFDGKDWADHAFVATSGPRKGLLTLLDAPPVSDKALAAIPQSATLAGVAKFDPAKFLATVRQVAVDIDPGAGEQFDDAMRQVAGMLGLDVQKDFLAALGDEWAYYTDPNTGGRGLLGVVLVNRLRDPAKAASSLDALENFATAQLAEQMKGEEVKVSFYMTKYGDLTIHYLGTPLITPSWAIQDGNLYVGLFPQVVGAAADHVRAKGRSILDNPDFVALRKRLAGDNAAKATGFQFMDLPRTAPDAYANWLIVSRLSGFADMFGIQSPAMLLPPLPKLLPQLTPAGSVSWSDDAGWHARAVSPFPGASLLASDPLSSMMATQPLMLSILLPSLNRAREQANQVKGMSDLRQIGLGAMLYANDHKDRFPDSLGEIAKTQEMTPQVFVHPGDDVPPDFKNKDDLAAWVDEHSVFIWTGKGRKTSAGPDVILAYEKPVPGRNRVNVLFADGHCEALPLDEVQRRVTAPSDGEK